MIAAAAGGTIGALLYVTCFYIFANDNSTLLLWCCVGITSAIAAVVSMIFFDYAVIWGSAVFGAYVFVRGISIFAGGYPSEFDIAMSITNKSLSETTWTFFLYLVAMIVLAVISIVS